MSILKRVLYSLITIVVFVYLGIAVMALFSDRILFQPQRSTYRDDRFPTLRGASQSSPKASAVQVIKLHSQTRGARPTTITAIYLPNSGATHTLLFSHGNAEDLGDDLPILEMFRDAGFAAFAYDYRGYGTSEGRSSEPTIYSDADAAYEYLTRNLNVPPARIIAFGRSLGSAAAIHTAAESRPASSANRSASDSPVAGLIVEAPFLSAFRVLTRVPLLPWDKFRNLSKIRRIHVPILVIHGRKDGIVPFWHGERIYRQANPPKQHLWIDRAGHNDVLYIAGPQYLRAIRSFADSLPK
ncbi:MAG TPA: alpha/beta hydrolase [Clostridia bacterium]|nr:alpha/beta hydrolase [Clostridia bacterium]